MAITAITPALNSEIVPGASFAFTIDDTYTSLVIKVQTATALVNAYSTALGGGQSGYSVAVVDNGDGTHTVTTSADSGWDVSPQLIYVVEDETGSSATTNLSYEIVGEAPFPQGKRPYNATTDTATGPLNNYAATAAPGATDDADDGYTAGSAWVDITNDESYRLLDPTVGAAVWAHTSGAAASGDVVGPGSAADDALAVYDGTSGKLLKDSTGTIAQIVANTAKTTNQTHVGDVAGATTLTIGALKVLEGMLAAGAVAVGGAAAGSALTTTLKTVLQRFFAYQGVGGIADVANRVGFEGEEYGISHAIQLIGSLLMIAPAVSALSGAGKFGKAITEGYAVAATKGLMASAP